MIPYQLIMTYENKNYDVRKFTNIDKDYTIWTIYHGSAIPKQFNLFETNNNKLFNSANVGYDGLCLNNLNRFICESCGILYPYMNNLKSEIIGFEHYRRKYDTINFEKIKSGWTQCWKTIHLSSDWKRHNLNFDDIEYKGLANYFAHWYAMDNGCYEDTIMFLNEYYPEMLDTAKEFKDLYVCTLFITEWDKYEHIARFILDYINFINIKYDLKYNEKKWYLHVYEKTILNYNLYKDKQSRCVKEGIYWNMQYNQGFDGYLGTKTSDNLWRIYAYYIEYLVSLYLHTYEKVFILK